MDIDLAAIFRGDSYCKQKLFKETKVVMQNAMVFKHVDASPETKSSCQDV
jgi:hypothetical protein